MVEYNRTKWPEHSLIPSSTSQNQCYVYGLLWHECHSQLSRHRLLRFKCNRSSATAAATTNLQAQARTHTSVFEWTPPHSNIGLCFIIWAQRSITRGIPSHSHAHRFASHSRSHLFVDIFAYKWVLTLAIRNPNIAVSQTTSPKSNNQFHFIEYNFIAVHAKRPLHFRNVEFKIKK